MLTLVGEIAIFLVGVGALVWATRLLGRPLSPTAAGVAAVVAFCALGGAAGVIVSSKRSLDAYRISVHQSSEQRLAGWSSPVTRKLSSEGVTSALTGAPPLWFRFARWLRARLPSDATFAYKSGGASAEFYEARFWIDSQLLPRTQVGSAKNAGWVIFFDATPNAGPGSHRYTFAPRFVLLKVAGND